MGWASIGSAILSFLSGGSVANITQAIENITKARADKEIALGTAATQAEKEAALKSYDFQIAALQTMATVMIAEQSWWLTRLIRPTFAYICAFHFGGVVLSSFEAWRPVVGVVDALPTPLDWLELGIIGSYFALRPFEKNTRSDLVKSKLGAAP
jgi:Holin of 3TMs, for gene-transfer release